MWQQKRVLNQSEYLIIEENTEEDRLGKCKEKHLDDP